MKLPSFLKRRNTSSTQEFPRFNPKGRATPQTDVPFSHMREGSSVSPIEYLLYLGGDEPPYCPKAEGRWEVISKNQDFLAQCAKHDNIIVRVRDFRSGEMRDCAKTRVIHKKNIPIPQNENSGLAKIQDKLYVVSPIFLDEKNIPFVLVVRHAALNSDVENTLKSIL